MDCWSSSGASKRVSYRSSTVPIAILPSADSACSRTSGSGSSRACYSTGTSSTVPMLPSTTVALRFKPRSFARFIGDRRNAAAKSSCDIARISCATVLASFPAIASRDANACSFSSWANLMLYGQTSWENCRYTHFEISLATGRRTLRKTKG